MVKFKLLKVDQLKKKLIDLNLKTTGSKANLRHDCCI